MAHVLGIDLGTTNSCAAVFETGEPTVIENVEGGRTTPSVVAITEDAEQLIGQIARRQAITNPANTVYSIKRLMGRKLKDEEIKRAQPSLPYSIVPGPNGDAYVELAGQAYAPPQVSAMILAKIRADVEARVGEEVTQAVITVPAYFDDAQRQATKDAGRIAGLDVLRIINEPTAAALAYGLGRTTDETVAVYDLGGGTFDISILQLGGDVFKVRGTNGDTHLGGDDFDIKIIDWLVDEFYREHTIDLRQDRMALQRLKDAAERAKIDLSSLLHARINLPFIAAGPEGPLHLVTMLTRSKLEGLVGPLVEATIEPCRRALRDASLEPEQIDTVILVGGQTRMPAVQKVVRDLFGKAPSNAVNPDEVVALGAAIEAGVAAGMVEDVTLLDVTPLSLGVEIQGGDVALLIPRSTTVPAMCSEIFTTAFDGQDSVDVHVMQGERLVATENRSLARFHLAGIPFAARGVPQIEVVFAIDANGILSVAARDLATGQAHQITVTPSSGLEEDDVQRMVDDAATYMEADRERQSKIGLRNEADVLFYQASRAAIDIGDGMSIEQQTAIEEALSLLEAAIGGEDEDQIRSAMASVETVLSAVRSLDSSEDIHRAWPLASGE